MAEVFYSDINLGLKTDASGNVYSVTNDDAINQSIRTILSTVPGERIMEPEFGSYLKRLLFDPMEESTVDFIQAEIQQAINRWEDRIFVSKVSVIPDYDRQTYDVTIFWTTFIDGRRGTFSGTLASLA